MYLKWIFSGKSTTKIYEKISDGHNLYKRKIFTLFTHKNYLLVYLLVFFYLSRHDVGNTGPKMKNELEGLK